jgi:dienelactone hydrolase
MRSLSGAAPELPPHAFSLPCIVPGSGAPAERLFVLTRDEAYVPVVLRRPPGPGPFPVVTMGRGDGRGGMPHVEAQVARMAPLQDRMLARGYAVAYVNYRNEIPGLYGRIDSAHNVADDISGGEGRTLKSAPTLDSDDLVSVLRYFAAQSWVCPGGIGAIGVSHGGEMILKAAAAMGPDTCLAAGVVVEGASHEFLAVDTGPSAPRIGGELQYRVVEVTRRNADQARAMARIRRIVTPVLHIGRAGDHLYGIFRLAHEWMHAAGCVSTWQSFTHPDHGFAFATPGRDGVFAPDAVQQAAFESCMAFFDTHLKGA